MTDYKLLKIMKNISKTQKDEIQINEIMKVVKLNNNDLYALVNDLLNNGYIEKSKSTIYIDSLNYVQDYRITNKGFDFLKKQMFQNFFRFMNEFKNWLALIIAIAAFIKSFFS